MLPSIKIYKEYGATIKRLILMEKNHTDTMQQAYIRRQNERRHMANEDKISTLRCKYENKLLQKEKQNLQQLLATKRREEEEVKLRKLRYAMKNIMEYQDNEANLSRMERESMFREDNRSKIIRQRM